MRRYHIMYTDRAGNVQTGRVSVVDTGSQSAANVRGRAITAARFRFPDARPATIRAVAIGGRIA